MAIREQDQGIPAVRFGYCILCNSPYRYGDPIATAPERRWKTSAKGQVCKLGHIECVAKARADTPAEDAAQCDMCESADVRTQLVDCGSRKVLASFCPDCAAEVMETVQDMADKPTCDTHDCDRKAIAKYLDGEPVNCCGPCSVRLFGKRELPAGRWRRYGDQEIKIIRYEDEDHTAA